MDISPFLRGFKDGGILEGRNKVDAEEQISLGAYVYFWTHADETILMNVGISTKSIDDARARLAHELPGWDFDRLCRESEKAR
jgi:putative alpha-1,2-mannosidase